jgi:hypothetical protein
LHQRHQQGQLHRQGQLVQVWSIPQDQLDLLHQQDLMRR